MFDFYNYLNSPDISRHLRKIGYAFSAPEAAWVVFNSQRATLEEKHRAYNAIIDELPDDFGGGDVGIHECLRGLMKAENEAAEQFKADDGPCVYLYGDSLDSCMLIANGLFDTFDACFQAATKWGHNFDSVRIRKEYLGCPEPGKSTWLDEVFRVADGKLMVIDMEEDNALMEYWDMFFDMVVDFPVPFKRGDILFDRYGNRLFLDTGLRDQDGNLLDMRLCGLYIDENGEAFEVEKYETNYMDCERLPTRTHAERSYTDTFRPYIEQTTAPTPVEKALLLFRNFVREEDFSLATLCRQYSRLWLESMMKGDPVYEKNKPDWGAPFVKIWVDPHGDAPRGYVWCIGAEQAAKFVRNCKWNGIGVDLVDMRDPRVCREYEGLPDECGDVDVRFHGGDITDSWRLKKQKNSHEEE